MGSSGRREVDDQRSLAPVKLRISKTRPNRLQAAANRQRRGGFPTASQIPVGPRTRIKYTGRGIIQRFPKIIQSDEAIERSQIFDSSIRHHMSEEMHRVGQRLSGRLEPHDTLSYSQKFGCLRQWFHGLIPFSGRLA
jgi:hypothetical protein